MPELRSEGRALRSAVEAEALGPAEIVELRARIDARLQAPRWRPWLVLAPAAVAVLLLVFVWPRSAGFEVTAGAGCAQIAGAEVRVGACAEPVVVAASGADVRLSADTVVQVAAAGATVRSGRARFTVAKRAHEPYAVTVSHGRIEVLGTVFDVEQDAGRGSVELHEGRVAFVWNDGTREVLAPGERLSWPRAAAHAEPAPTPEPAPVPAQAAPAAAPRPRAARDRPSPAEQPVMELREVLERLAQLRGQRRFAEAAELMRATLRGLEGAQAERLSYDLGALLAGELGDHAGACAQWRAHAERFPDGLRKKDVSERLEGCAP